MQQEIGEATVGKFSTFWESVYKLFVREIYNDVFPLKKVNESFEIKLTWHYMRARMMTFKKNYCDIWEGVELENVHFWGGVENRQVRIHCKFQNRSVEIWLNTTKINYMLKSRYNFGRYMIFHQKREYNFILFYKHESSRHSGANISKSSPKPFKNPKSSQFHFRKIPQSQNKEVSVHPTHPPKNVFLVSQDPSMVAGQVIGLTFQMKWDRVSDSNRPCDRANISYRITTAL